MADEKQPTPETGPDAASIEPSDDGPANQADAGELAEADHAVTENAAETTETAAEPGKRRGGRGAMAALAIIGLLAVGLYLAWPSLQPRLLALLPPAAAETLAAVKALDHRVAQLEAASDRLDSAVGAIKSAMTAFSKQMDELSTGLSGGEVLAALREKFAAMETALAEIGQTAGESGGAALAALSGEVEALKARLVALASAPANEAPQADAGKLDALRRLATALADENKELRQTLATLRTDLARLEQAVRKSALARRKTGAGEGLVLAIGQLRQTVLSGGAYTAPLAAVTALAGDDAALQPAARSLAPWARNGVATLRALSDSYPAMARAVLRADPGGAGGTDGFWRRTLHRVSSLVTVRRLGEVEGMEADAILARAERRLAAAELAAAIALIETLQDPGGAAAQDWLGRARARLAALAALAELQSRAIVNLADG